ncbi:MAG: NF038130 family PEP-CTERM protein [Oscillatoria princeps RMCB-10]|jgi:hypothetical protein|nr:NF038130 family PEP-CTERM protein [Oscillatoria princeps RMCB-10]
MPGLVKKLLVASTVAVGVTALASAPAKAGSLTGGSITGGAEYNLYDVRDSNNDGIVDEIYRNDAASLSTILSGNSGSPTGNVELFANSEKSPIYTSSADSFQQFTALSNFLGYSQSSTLSGQIGGRDISLSSLTAADWFGASAADSTLTGITNASAIVDPAARLLAFNAAIAPLYSASNLATQWFNTALSTYASQNPLVSTYVSQNNQTLFTGFLLAGGFQRFSDPNISYVNQNDTTGEISIGLAGYYDAKSLLLPVVPPELQPLLPAGPLQASELVKVAYNGGPAQYLYSLSATPSGLANAGSATGNYELLLAGIPPAPPASVPEPSAMLGLMGVGGFLAAKRKIKNA